MSMEVPLLNCLVRVVSLFCFDFLLYSWITCMRCGVGGGGNRGRGRDSNVLF